MKIIIIALVAFYLLMAAWFFTLWLKFFKRDTSLSSADRLLYMVILVIATILWPVVVPIAYLELLQEKIKDQDVSAIAHSSSWRWEHVTLAKVGLIREDRTVDSPSLVITPKQQQALHEHIQAIAKILYKDTSPELIDHPCRH